MYQSALVVLTPWGIFSATEMLDEIESLRNKGDYAEADDMWVWYEMNRHCFFHEQIQLS
jgi:hypothetical protein